MMNIIIKSKDGEKSSHFPRLLVPFRILVFVVGELGFLCWHNLTVGDGLAGGWTDFWRGGAATHTVLPH